MKADPFMPTKKKVLKKPKAPKRAKRAASFMDRLKTDIEKALGAQDGQKPPPAKKSVPSGEEIQKKIEAYKKVRKAGGKSAQEARNFRNGLKETAKKLAKAAAEPHDFIKTGVPGFDKLLEEGIPRRSSLLVAGGPGTGKTIICLQIAANACMAGKKCIYISFEEHEENLKKHMRDFGWAPEKWENEGRLIVKRISPYELSRSVEALLAQAKGELLIELESIPAIIPKGMAPDIIVIDSLTAVAAAFVEREDTYRIYIEQFFRLLEKMGATAFLITETAEAASTYSRSGVEEFLADGVIALYHIRKDNVRIRGIEIIKLRGTRHIEKMAPFDIISHKGIVVYPEEEIFV